jgi:hypothetical protein
MSETPDLDEGAITAPDPEDHKIEEIARAHPSAGGDEAQGVEQGGNTEGDEHAADGGTGAGEDYAGSGL